MAALAQAVEGARPRRSWAGRRRSRKTRCRPRRSCCCSRAPGSAAPGLRARSPPPAGGAPAPRFAGGRLRRTGKRRRLRGRCSTSQRTDGVAEQRGIGVDAPEVEVAERRDGLRQAGAHRVDENEVAGVEQALAVVNERKRTPSPSSPARRSPAAWGRTSPGAARPRTSPGRRCRGRSPAGWPDPRRRRYRRCRRSPPRPPRPGRRR